MQKLRFKTDEDLLEELKAKNENSIRYLYKLHFPMVLNFVLSNSGSEEEAKDVYQDAFIVLYNNVSQGEFKLNCKLKTYIYSIVRRLWLNELKIKKLSTGDLIDNEGYINIVKEELDEIDDYQTELQIMSESLNEMGEPCNKILSDFYFDKLAMSEIVKNMGYSNTDTAKNVKYKCLMRLKKIFFNKLKSYNNAVQQRIS